MVKLNVSGDPKKVLSFEVLKVPLTQNFKDKKDKIFTYLIMRLSLLSVSTSLQNDINSFKQVGVQITGKTLIGNS